MKFTIVTPSYNQGKYIEGTIKSVINQEGSFEIEYIVIDGGSLDETVEIIKKYEPYIKYWHSRKDKGQSDAINQGLAIGEGDVFAYLNSDDVYTAGAFAKVEEFFRKNPEIEWVAGEIFFSSETGEIFDIKRPLYSKMAILLAESSIYQPSVFVRRSLVDKVGLIDENFHAIMDQEWFYRMSKYGKPGIINSPLSIFRWHANSKSSSDTHSRHYKRYLEERIILMKREIKFLKPINVKNYKIIIRLANILGKIEKLRIRLMRSSG